MIAQVSNVKMPKPMTISVKKAMLLAKLSQLWANARSVLHKLNVINAWSDIARSQTTHASKTPLTIVKNVLLAMINARNAFLPSIFQLTRVRAFQNVVMILLLMEPLFVMIIIIIVIILRQQPINAVWNQMNLVCNLNLKQVILWNNVNNVVQILCALNVLQAVRKNTFQLTKKDAWLNVPRMEV